MITDYGVSLRKLEANNPEDIEYCRVLRNQEEVRSKLFYSGVVSPQEHLEWFAKLTGDDFYFVVLKDAERVGQCSFKLIGSGKAIPGCYFDSKYHGTDIPFRMSLCLADCAFTWVDKLMCEIKSDNKPAIKLNTFLGYKIVETREDRVILELTKEDYLTAKIKIIKMLK